MVATARTVFCSMALFIAACAVGAANGQDRADLETRFRAWLADDLWPAARRSGVSRATFDTAFDGVSLDWNLPDFAPPGGRADGAVVRQSEFRSPAGYFDEGRINRLVSSGRAALSRWGDTLAAIERRYGVPARIIVAIWGRESDYGRASIPHYAVRALATQAFMGRRQAFFRAELIAALRILEGRHVPPKELKSSWAGGLGHPQFLPSNFHRYAVDFDGDGHRDIWRSVPDALASIASFLQRNGWQTGRDWGFESDIPGSLPCTLEGPDKGRPIAEWAELGVRRVRGRQFPEGEAARTGFLLMPAGRFGPAYLATENFYVLKRYNESDLYALFIGHLADRLGANTPFAGGWAAVGGFTRGDVRRMQERLEARGYDVGGADGLIGFRTRVAVGEWQARAGKTPTCFPTTAEVRTIG